ncbi:hypothetical protein THRCLA_00410 [Thraustotheca clavata]|uniref:Uncharacterized protein n=1 Tax=Thraustotheca clavata TaxID=74557 RepID=A0A1W0ABE7_9STRA|nr:hypothetical protein THRCLA_00410 [Thraustotheca clavata]
MTKENRRQSKEGISDHEYLVMERELYEESIRAMELRLAQLRDGTLQEYVEQCQVFAQEKQERMDMALLHRQLLEKNSQELLEFDLQQLHDVYAAKALDPLVPLPYEPDDVAEMHSLKMELQSDQEIIVALQQVQASKKALFNMQHVASGEKQAMEILAQLQSTREAWQEAQATLAKVESKPLECIYDADQACVFISDRPFAVGDAIILKSELVQEEYYGEIIRMDSNAVLLKLVCGSHVNVSLESLRTRRCRLMQQHEALSSLGQFSPLQTTPIRHSATPRSRRTSRSRRALSLL